MDVHAERGEGRRREVPGLEALATRLVRRVGPEQRAQMQHGHAERVADEVAGLVDGDVLRRRAVPVQHEDPGESIARELAAEIGHHGTDGRLAQAVGAGMDRPATQLVGAAVPEVQRRHQDDVPGRQRPAEARGRLPGFVRDANRVGANRQVRPVLLEHADRKEDDRTPPVQGIDLGPGELVETVNPGRPRLRVGSRAWRVTGERDGRAETAHEQPDEHWLHA
jgi:hypothetical protein